MVKKIIVILFFFFLRSISFGEDNLIKAKEDFGKINNAYAKKYPNLFVKLTYKSFADYSSSKSEGTEYGFMYKPITIDPVTLKGSEELSKIQVDMNYATFSSNDYSGMINGYEGVLIDQSKFIN